MTMTTVTLAPDGHSIAITDGTQTARFHAIWLRDNAWDTDTRSVGNGQRLITLQDIPPATKIAAVDVSGQTLTLTFQPEDKTIDYDINWLLQNTYDTPQQNSAGWTAPDVETWDMSIDG